MPADDDRTGMSVTELRLIADFVSETSIPVFETSESREDDGESQTADSGDDDRTRSSDGHHPLDL